MNAIKEKGKSLKNHTFIYPYSKHMSRRRQGTKRIPEHSDYEPKGYGTRKEGTQWEDNLKSPNYIPPDFRPNGMKGLIHKAFATDAERDRILLDFEYDDLEEDELEQMPIRQYMPYDEIHHTTKEKEHEDGTITFWIIDRNDTAQKAPKRGQNGLTPSEQQKNFDLIRDG